MSHPAGLPDLFLDRSLGRKKVPAELRAAGLRLLTLAEHYGIPADERVPDEEWLKLVGERGWVAFTKDTRLRYNRAEKQALQDYGVRCFGLTGKNLRAHELAKRFLQNLPAITRACTKPGPFVYAVHSDRIEQLALSEKSEQTDSRE